jgi:hypothetical protein
MVENRSPNPVAVHCTVEGGDQSFNPFADKLEPNTGDLITGPDDGADTMSFTVPLELSSDRTVNLACGSLTGLVHASNIFMTALRAENLTRQQ